MTLKPIPGAPISAPIPDFPTGEPGPTDEAKEFLLALRDGDSPIVIPDSRSGFQVEFVIAEDGPTFTVGKPDQERISRRLSRL